MSSDAELERALALHQSGKLADAEQAYRRVLASNPNHTDALHWLGVLAHQCGNTTAAIQLIGQAISIEPNKALYFVNIGITLQAIGELDQASIAYRKAIELAPNFAEAYNGLGSIFRQQGDLSAAVDLFYQAIQVRSDYAIGYANLGSALVELDRSREAIPLLSTARQLAPDNAEIAYNLGNARRDLLDFGAAIAAYRDTIALDAKHADARNNLANLLKEVGEFDESLTQFRMLVEQRPDYAAGYHNLGATLSAMGRLDEALIAFKKAIELAPNQSVTHNLLGIAYYTLGDLDRAIAAYRQAIELQPNFADAYSNLGVALADSRQLDQAIEAYEQAIRLDPGLSNAYNNLGFIYKDRGQLDQAIASYRKAMTLSPSASDIHSNLIYLLHFHRDYDNAAINREHAAWQKNHAEPLRQRIVPHRNSRTTDRRLKIGYVSPNFSTHVICYFLLPLLENHNHDEFEIVCYSSVKRPDFITERMMASSDHWRSVTGQSHSKVASIIRDDQIDILVDLTQHMGGNRLLVFAEKPAPVQVAWLGYPGSNGLEAMDYRISDHVMEPIGASWSLSVEEVLRLPHCWFVYDPLCNHRSPTALPALQTGVVTFGSLNNFCKLNDEVLELWSRILAAVPNSRILIQCPEGEPRKWVRVFFHQRGIAMERIAFVGRIQGRDEFLRLFDAIDIALDPFPYNGGTSTCEALWMGIPLLALTGDRIVSRIGRSILQACGLDEFIADSPSQFLEIAQRLATDLPKLAHYRRTIRDRIRSSPFTDYQSFARNMELLYRRAWSTWCST